MCVCVRACVSVCVSVSVSVCVNHAFILFTFEYTYL